MRSPELREFIREFYNRAHMQEPVYDVYEKMEKLVTRKGLKPMSEQAQNGSATVEAVATATQETEAPKAETPTGRTQAKKPGRRTPPRRKANGAAQPVQVVTLSPAQVCNLWKAAMGGELVIERTPDGGLLCQVSFASFEKALPVLLDNLKGG